MTIKSQARRVPLSLCSSIKNAPMHGVLSTTENVKS